MALLLGMALTTHPVWSQASRVLTLDSVVQEISLRVDTQLLRYPADARMLHGEWQLPFPFQQDAQVVEVGIRLRDRPYLRQRTLQLEASTDYDLLDSVRLIEDTYRFRLRFRSLSRSEFLPLVLLLSSPDRQDRVALRLFPYTATRAVFYPGHDDLFIGEEKRFELVTNNQANIRLDGEWKKDGDLSYRVLERNGQAFIDLIPQFIGTRRFTLQLEAYRPWLDAEGQLQYALPPMEVQLQVRGSRLSFLRLDQKEIIRERDNRNGVEVQLDNHRQLQLNRTYRIEDREEKGGPLVAELFTVRHLSNDKVLCLLRPYDYHSMSEGYLFVKDGDQAMFITNVNILPEARIQSVQVLREGQSWSSDTRLYPGERVEVRLEGEGFSQARFYFEDLDILRLDTLTRSDKVATYTLEVPIDLRKRAVDIYNKGKRTGYSLQITEYQRPRPLDFILLDFGEGPIPLRDVDPLIFYDKTVRDLVLSFDPSQIDRGGQLYGRQMLELELRLTGPRNELIEMQRLGNIEVCPAENSPRFAYYQSTSCQRDDLSLNSLLFRKTHSLEGWSRMELIVRHRKENYGGEGYTQRVEIILQRRVTFDVEVSFPAGLMVKRVGVDGFPGLGGISLAMLAEFSFYHQNQIRRLKPFKLGAGFLAQNAFNFSPEVRDRDLGIVMLGSLYPIRRDKKLTFPLYAGFGYFINERRFFYLLGPGIRVNF